VRGESSRHFHIAQVFCLHARREFFCQTEASVHPLDAWAFTLFPNKPVPENLRIAEAMRLGRVDFTALSPEEILAG
jgi:hypothetical protein